MARTDERTGQLREYDIRPGSLDAFFAFWSQNVVPLREDFGFRVEWYLADADESRFVWFVSAPGDAAAFREREDTYNESSQRQAVFARLEDDPVRGLRYRIVSACEAAVDDV